MKNYAEEVKERGPFDRLSLLLAVDAPIVMMADLAADEIERLREQLAEATRDAGLFTDREKAERRRQWRMVGV